MVIHTCIIYIDVYTYIKKLCELICTELNLEKYSTCTVEYSTCTEKYLNGKIFHVHCRIFKRKIFHVHCRIFKWKNIPRAL